MLFSWNVIQPYNGPTRNFTPFTHTYAYVRVHIYLHSHTLNGIKRKINVRMQICTNTTECRFTHSRTKVDNRKWNTCTLKHIHVLNIYAHTNTCSHMDTWCPAALGNWSKLDFHKKNFKHFILFSDGRCVSW